MFAYIISEEMCDRIRRWRDLKRWERREIGQELRQMGLSYTEIASVIPVSKGTLSGWCRDIRLTEGQRSRLASLRPQTTVGDTLRARNKARTEAIRVAAAAEADALSTDPFWTAGLVAYWSEGSKRCNEVSFSNSDVALVRLFIAWAKQYLDVDESRFSVRLHLHSGQDEAERRAFWSQHLGLAAECILGVYVKPEGTGHRKNELYNGTAFVRVSKSTDLLHRVLGWIDFVATARLALG